MISTATFDRGLAAVTAAASAHIGHLVSHHPRSVSAAVMLALAGFGVTAFGVSSLAPDAADLPQRLVTEIVTPNAIQSQLDALAEHELQLYRTDLTRSADTADSLLKRLNVSDVNAALFIRSDPTARQLLAGRGGKMVRVQTDENGKLTELVARYAPANADQFGTHFTRLRIARIAGQWNAALATAPLAAQVRIGSGTIRSSLFAATDEARMPDSIATQLTEVFATDVDFHRQLRKGDTFSVVYEALTADGEPITWAASNAGRVLAAEFVNNGKTYSAVWYQDGAAKGAYYGLDGKSKKHAFLASPLEFSRVTSGFAMRMHPILNSWKQHKGVDYGAPTGTPIRAIGDGVVEFAGWQNGYGNVVEVKHSGQRSTLYAHMSHVDVKKGARVEQGQRIGAVGSTGWATGPHLHFEVKVGGVQEDPMLLARSAETTELTASAKTRFVQYAQSMRGQLDVADTVSRFGAYAE